MASKLHFILAFLFNLTVILCHYVPKIKSETVEINSYINQASEIAIPFKKCFQVRADLQANNVFIQFEPSSLELVQDHGTVITNNSQISILEDLRSPRTFTHEHLLVFDEYSLTFLAPNTIKVIKLIESQFKVIKEMKIKEINQYVQFKLYKFNQQAIMMAFYNQQQTRESFMRAFLISDSGYREIKMPKTSPIAHFEANGKQFFTAQYNGGVHCYSYSQGSQSIKLVAQYSSSISQNPYIVDINIDNLKDHNIIYALDARKGVYRINLTDSKRQPKVDLIIAEPNCNAMDSMNVNHIVLVCQLGSASFIVEAYGKQLQSGELIFQKIQPEYHVNYFNDLEINKNYFLVFSQRTLNVYWSSKQNNIPETVNTRSQLDLPGLQTFYFKMSGNGEGESFLYLIQSGVMKKMSIRQSQAKLVIKSSHIVEKAFKLSIFGNCHDLADSQFDTQNNKIKLDTLQSSTCQLEKTIKLSVIEEKSPRKQDFSVSASIVVILIVIFLLIIWICLKKYKGLEREARRVLEGYKKKKSRARI